MEHTKDSDCTKFELDADTDELTICAECKTMRLSDPCLKCGQHSFHKPDCPNYDAEDNRVFMAQTFERGH
jgi:hypothetical protein